MVESQRVREEPVFFWERHRIRLPPLTGIVHKCRLVGPDAQILHPEWIVSIDENLMANKASVTLGKFGHHVHQERHELRLQPRMKAGLRHTNDHVDHGSCRSSWPPSSTCQRCCPGLTAQPDSAPARGNRRSPQGATPSPGSARPVTDTAPPVRAVSLAQRRASRCAMAAVRSSHARRSASSDLRTDGKCVVRTERMPQKRNV